MNGLGDAGPIVGHRSAHSEGGCIMVEKLETERMLLRQPRRSDAGPMTLYAGDKRVSGMTTSIPHPYSQQMADTFIEQILAGNHREDVWAMDAALHGGAEFIGLISLKRDAAEIGYWIGPPFWSTGYASEALEAITAHLMNDRGLAELNASVFFDNPASQQVLRKAGFTETGRTWLYSVARESEVPALTFRLGEA